MYDDTVVLVAETDAENDIGDSVKAYTKRTVFADRKSVRQSEFYQAATTGLRPDYMFEMRRTEYQGEPKLEYDGITYQIIRTFEKNRDFIELIAQGTTGDES